jgi:quinol monooxygenase YgiN
MYVRISTITYDPAQEEEVLRIADEQLIPVLRRLPGFQSYTVSFDRAQRRGIAIGTWDSLEHDQLIRAATREIIAQLNTLGLEAETAQLYEIVRQV